MLDTTKLDRQHAAARRRLWDRLRIGLLTIALVSGISATVIRAHAQQAPPPAPILQPLPDPPKYVAVNVSRDMFQPLVTDKLTIQEKAANATTNEHEANVEVRFCTAFLNPPPSALLLINGQYANAELKPPHNRIGDRRIVHIGANAIELDDGTIIERGDCESDQEAAQQQQQQVQQQTNNTTQQQIMQGVTGVVPPNGTTYAPGPYGSIPYQQNQNQILVPGPSQSNTIYDKGSYAPQKSDPYNQLYGAPEPESSAYPPYIPPRPGSTPRPQ